MENKNSRRKITKISVQLKKSVKIEKMHPEYN